MSEQKPETREPIVGEFEDGSTYIGCNLDMSHCDHEFTQTNDPDSDHCVKCGQSVWAMAFMECP